MSLILKSAVARAQREEKVILCHQNWMANHPHFLVVALDAEDLAKFCKEVKVAITESIKKLCGIEHLALWERNGSMRAELLDLQAVVEKIAYQYNNACSADLVDQIEDYPGVTSFRAFLAADTLDYSETELVPWVRRRAIPTIGSRGLTESQDSRLVREMTERTGGIQHRLITRPNAWMTHMGVNSDVEARKVNARILELIRSGEAEHRRRRAEDTKSIMGQSRLRREAIRWNYKRNRKNQRKIFVISSCPKRRATFIANHDRVCEICGQLYRRACNGEIDLPWPPGIFKPRIPRLANALAPRPEPV